MDNIFNILNCFVFVFIVVGVALHDRRDLHAKMMITAFVLDLALLLAVEFSHSAVEPTQESVVQVDPVAFDELMDEAPSAVPESPASGANLDLIMDVEVPVSVVLGTVRKSIGEVVSLTEGQVIDLERSAGEAVDLLVNGKLVARGEVVVVDDHYGIRIAEIIAPGDRLNA